MRQALVLAGAVALLAAGCGSNHATDVLAKTAARLGDIHSGDLNARLLVQPHGLAGAHAFGFKLHGPFQLRRGAAPLLNVTYTQIANGRQASVTVTSTGDRAWVTSGGKTYAVPTSSFAQLSSSSGSGSSGLRLGLDKWVKNAKTTSCAGGFECISADVDVEQAARDLLALARRLSGRDLPQLDDAQAKRLRNAVDSSTMRVKTGKRDHLLRHLQIDADLGANLPASLRRALQGFAGAHFRFELGVARPNTAVHIAGT